MGAATGNAVTDSAFGWCRDVRAQRHSDVRAFWSQQRLARSAEVRGTPSSICISWAPGLFPVAVTARDVPIMASMWTTLYAP